MKIIKKICASLLFVILSSVCLVGCGSFYKEGHREYTSDNMSELGSTDILKNIVFSQASPNSSSTTVAEVKTKDGTVEYYDDIADAWSDAITRNNEELQITLYQDWIAVDGSFKSKDDQKGFGKTGGLELTKRTAPLVLCLNNRKLDRGLTSPIDSGSVISINCDVKYFEVCFGTITGGYAKGKGGGCYINTKDSVCFESVKINNNRSKGNGGGVFVSSKKGWVWFKNCYITDNISDNYGGGLYLDATTKNLFKNVYCELGFSCYAYVMDNIGKDGRNNLIVRNSNLNGNSYVKYLYNIYYGSKIYINTSKNAPGEYVTETFMDEYYEEDFEIEYVICDNSKYKINCHKNDIGYSGVLKAAEFKCEVVNK